MTNANTIAADVLAAEALAKDLRATLEVYPDASRVDIYTYSDNVNPADITIARVSTPPGKHMPHVQFGTHFGRVSVWPDRSDGSTWHSVEQLIEALLEDPMATLCWYAC